MTLGNFIGPTVKRTVGIGAIAMWYPFGLANLSEHVGIAKTLF